MSAGPATDLATFLRRRGLAAPARLLLDAHRPLRPLLAETGAWLQPVLSPLFGRRYAGLRGVLDDADQYDAVIEELTDAEHR